MKLLLTSSGLRNQSIIDHFLAMAGKPAKDLKVAFIPTALNTEPGDKGWAIDQMLRIRDLGVKHLDIVDISAVEKEVWLPRLIESNVIFVNGGNTTHLMHSFNDSGLTQEIPKLLKTRLYVGVSAGSYVATPDIRFNTDNVDEELEGLKLVDFGLQAHLYSPKFPIVRDIKAVKRRVAGCPYPVYALDDEMAVKVFNDKVELVGEGEWEKFDPAKE